MKKQDSKFLIWSFIGGAMLYLWITEKAKAAETVAGLGKLQLRRANEQPAPVLGNRHTMRHPAYAPPLQRMPSSYGASGIKTGHGSPRYGSR